MKTGSHQPQLCVFGGNNSQPIFMVFAEFPSDGDIKRSIMRGAGNRIKDLMPDAEEVYLISEAWMSEPIDKNKYKKGDFIMPRNDPERKEVLLINAKDIKNDKNYFRIYNMIRDDKGNLIELTEKKLPTKNDTVSYLLEAFMFGYYQKQL